MNDDLFVLVRARRRLPPPAARRQLREQCGMSQADAALFVGVTRAAIVRWETGAREPRAANLVKYLELLDRLARESL
jgi:DNA-binding XRE family transcriptional regulator